MGRRRGDDRRACWPVTSAFAFVMLGTTAPSPLYPAYEERFGFGGLTVTGVYAVFAAGVLTALLVLGQASDALGRKRVLLPGVAVAVSSSALFLTAGAIHGHGFAILLAGRFLSGLSAGIFTGTAGAAIADLAGRERASRAGLIAAVANLAGTGLGPLLAGSIAQWAPVPLQTVYAIHLALLAVATIALVATPESVPVERRGSFTPRRPRIPPRARSTFVPAAAAAFAGFAVSGLFVAVTPALLAALGYHEPAYTGAVVSLMFAAGVAGTVTSSRMRTYMALKAGTALLLGAVTLLALALSERSLVWLATAAATAGTSQGIGLRGALASVNAAMPAAERGRVTSAFFAIAYVCGTSLPVVGVGVASRHLGLIAAGEAFTVMVGALALAVLVRIDRRSRTVRQRLSPTAPPRRRSTPRVKRLKRPVNRMRLLLNRGNP